MDWWISRSITVPFPFHYRSITVPFPNHFRTIILYTIDDWSMFRMTFFLLWALAVFLLWARRAVYSQFSIVEKTSLRAFFLSLYVCWRLYGGTSDICLGFANSPVATFASCRTYTKAGIFLRRRTIVLTYERPERIYVSKLPIRAPDTHTRENNRFSVKKMPERLHMSNFCSTFAR